MFNANPQYLLFETKETFFCDNWSSERLSSFGSAKKFPMKFILLLLSMLIFAPLLSLCGGGVWVLEVKFKVGNERQTGFIYADYWADDFEDSFLSKPKAFKQEFFEKYSKHEQLNVYSSIQNQAAIAEAAPFPMHPYFVIDSTAIEVQLSDIEKIRLIKVWKKSSYVVNVLNTLSVRDTTWFTDSPAVSHPIGGEAGCRLEVYHFLPTIQPNPALNALIAFYKKNGHDRENPDPEILRLTGLLSEMRIVVVELCGC